MHVRSVVPSVWRDVLARLPLPMLALAASYGVYRFAALFVPSWVAFVQAAAFELVYLGMAVVRLPQLQQKRARAISVGAVAVSVVYNSLDALFHRRPDILTAGSLWFDLLLSILHGAPLAIVAYLVADLLLHSSNGVSMPFGADASLTGDLLLPGRPQLYTVEDLLSAVEPDELVGRDALRQRLGCAASTVDRLLAEALQLGKLERVSRGTYRLP